MSTPGFDKAISRFKEAQEAVTRAARYAIMKEARRQGITKVELSLSGHCYERNYKCVRCEEIDELFERHQEEVGGIDLHDWDWSIDLSWRDGYGRRPGEA